MIVKRSADRGGKSRAASAKAIVEYITRAEKGERPLHIGSEGFFAESLQAQTAEMAALAQCAIRSRNPVSHFILSWPEHEKPTPEQADEAARIFMRELGLEGHQAIWALHDDTRVRHLHIALNRTHPETERAVKINKGFDINAAHRAVAIIEKEQGWEPEARALFQIDDQGQAVAAERDTNRHPTSKARDFEHRTGERSAQRVAIEDLAPLIREAASWKQLHAALADRGASYIKKGSGGLILVGETPIKASRADRSASLTALTKRLGPYEPAQTQVQEKTLSATPEQAMPAPSLSAARFLEYWQQRAAWLREKKAATEKLKARQEIEREALKRKHAQQRTEALRGVWRNRGEALNAMRAAVAAAQKADRAEQRKLHQAEREHLRERHPPLPSYEAWLRLGGHAKEADAWRERLRSTAIMGVSWVEPKPSNRADVRAFEAVPVGREVHYRREGRTDLVDRGRSIGLAKTDDTAILAALQIGHEKWGGVALRGSLEFRQRAATLAIAHRIQVRDPGEGVDLKAIQKAHELKQEQTITQSQTQKVHRSRERGGYSR
ncbi:TraI/MobA(P) family conjugative relaxase [Microvirga mediterraneensis]|uniref:Relaxase/mobilization nuclease domain-containing protein n=1 Tax=Microvirga mediterraneensis TaxID=2754695 RepID=A0A838BXU3_9HYPH|nr:TraI/MobA(P) family conjugative relaxase [Microvirga mediterraneensis]MBA1159396.1 relaxase/mobilization nuclease domain-containing protein [Microvirga mediterraneensis]